MIIKQKMAGFSLVELIVVIAIITAIVAVMIPANASKRQQAERLICNSNLKDMGNMLGVYAQDNCGRMVTNSMYTERWCDLLGEYYGGELVPSGEEGSRYDIEIFKCPVEWKRSSRMMEQGVYDSIAAASMYGYNSFFACPVGSGIASFPYYWFSRVDSIQTPSELPLFWDSSTDYSAKPTNQPSNQGFNGWPHMSLYAYGWDAGNARSVKDSGGGPAVNHPGEINALFADGHAQSNGLWIYKDTLSSPLSSNYYWSYFHPTRSQTPTTTIGDGWPCATSSSCTVP